MSRTEFAEQIFDVLRFSIDLACSDKDWFDVSRDALAFGFTQTDVSTANAYVQRFELQLEPDIYLCLDYRSFDPSGPFRSLPAVSKFDLTMSQGEQMLCRHQNSYDEALAENDYACWNDLSFA